jgi:hypothetical protein
MLKIDEHSSTFGSAAQGDGGAERFGRLERQRFKTWLKGAYEAIGSLGV